MEKIQILYVEDDETLGFITKDQLTLKGYEVDHYLDGATAVNAIKENNYDLAVLDVMLPNIDGFEIAKKLRSRDHEIPILFLSAKGMKEDRLKGFETGGDDYITKPFSMEELLMRIEVFLKRRKITDGETKQTIFIIGAYTFDYGNLLLEKEDNIETLTEREAELLKYLASSPNQVLKRSEILIKVWGEDDYFLGRSLDVFISRLRKYLRDDPSLKIENIHGVGFKLKV